EMRESLIKAAEKRLEDKVTELKDTEGRVNTAMGTRDQMEVQRFKSIVSMYENMKPKDAARIFDRLDMKILVDVSTQINPRRMSDILGQMSSEAAERLTVELAHRANAQPKTASADQLPKIRGKPRENSPLPPAGKSLDCTAVRLHSRTGACRLYRPDEPKKMKIEV